MINDYIDDYYIVDDYIDDYYIVGQLECSSNTSVVIYIAVRCEGSSVAIYRVWQP